MIVLPTLQNIIPSFILKPKALETNLWATLKDYKI
jgi:hypothetical protein